jgi:glucose-6-phosphate 1-dehydrogenase
VLRFALEPEGVVVELMGVGAHARTLAPLTLTADIEPAALPAHGRLLLDVFNRNAALSIRGDEAEESWRIVSWCSPPGRSAGGIPGRL